jgi:hypothetical protein
LFQNLVFDIKLELAEIAVSCASYIIFLLNLGPLSVLGNNGKRYLIGMVIQSGQNVFVPVIFIRVSAFLDWIRQNSKVVFCNDDPNEIPTTTLNYNFK